MNDKLRELAEQAEDYVESLGLSNNYWQSYSEKFAELIVKECAYVGDKYRSGTDVGNIIKQHFGVEE